MSLRCPACGEENRDGALICELCRHVFGRATAAPGASPAVPAPSPAAVIGAAAGPGAEPKGGRPFVIVQAPTAPRSGGGARVVGVVLGAAAAVALAFVVKSRVHVPASAAPPVAVERAAPAAGGTVAPVLAARAGARPAPLATAPAAGPPTAAPAATRPAAEPPAAEAAPVKPADTRKRFTIPYQAFEGQMRRIIIPVTINGSLTVPMALDTGAPGTIISFGLADRLGALRADDGKLLVRAGGIGGAVPAIRIVLDSLSVGGASTQFVPTTVTDQLSDAFDGLVGMDFLASYDVAIDTQRHLLLLTERPPRAAAPAGHDEQWWRGTYREFNGQKAQWEAFHSNMEDRLNKSNLSGGAAVEEMKQMIAVAGFQAQEAGKLCARLDRYASNNAVPREWR